MKMNHKQMVNAKSDSKKTKKHIHTPRHTHTNKTNRVQRKESTREWPSEERKPKIILTN